jgi:hypothetical protein
MKPRYAYIPLAVGVLTPYAVVFALEIFGHNRIGSSPMSPTSNPVGDLWLVAFTLIPFVALIVATTAVSTKLSPWRLECVFWGGLIAVVAFTAYGHVSVWWPLYFGGHMSSTAVVAFLFIPFYALVPLAAGMAIGYVISLVAHGLSPHIGNRGSKA